MDALVQDLRYALRTFRRQPGFVLTAVVALALGIGANTAVFSVVYAVLLRPLPFPHPERLVYVHDTYPAVTFASVSAAKFVALRDENTTLNSLAASAPATVTLTGGGEPEQVPATRTSATLAAVMGVPALLGRWFVEEEDLPNAAPVIVLGHSLWQRRFAADATLVGRTIIVNGEARTVVGVMPPGYTYPGLAEAWIPLGVARGVPLGTNFLRLVGRMQPGVSVGRVQEDLTRVTDRFNREHNLQRHVRVWPLHEIMVTTNRRALLVLQGAVAFVLLIACANVANLLLARGVGRHRELAMRAAVGASRLRLFRQLLTESLVLSGMGAILGVLFAGWLLRLFVRLAPASFPQLRAIAIDLDVLGFTVALATLTGVLFGFAPARRGLRTDPNDSLREMGTRTTTGGARGASRVLVVAEVAITLALLAGAGLMVKSLLKLQGEPPGFESDGVITFELSLPPVRYPDATPVAFFDRVLEEVRAVPGVERAGAIDYLPLANFGFNGPFAIEGRPPFPRDTAPIVEYRRITASYFDAMGIPIRLGRDFTPADAAGSLPVVIINDEMAAKYWPHGNPVGARLQLGDTTWREVVGVAGSVRSNQLNTPPVPEAYGPLSQAPGTSMAFVIRASGADPAGVLPPIRQRIAALDASLPLVRVRPMTAIVDASTGPARLTSVLTSVFALVAALLAAVGIYSLLAYAVAQRTREIGIRVALGADRRAVMRLIVGEGLGLTAIGLAIGITGALFLTRTLETLLYEVSPSDPGVLATTGGGVLAVAFLASVVPAWRALRVDPSLALRTE